MLAEPSPEITGVGEGHRSLGLGGGKAVGTAFRSFCLGTGDRGRSGGWEKHLGQEDQHPEQQSYAQQQPER